MTGLSGTDFQVKAILEEILEKVPEMFNMPEIMAKATERTPYVVVAFQECERMNILTNEMRRSLKELSLGLKVTWDSQDPGTGCRRRAGHCRALRDTGPRALGVGVALLPLGSRVWSCGPAGLGGAHLPGTRGMDRVRETRRGTCQDHVPPAPHPCVSQGELTITTDMEDLSTALFYDTVPDPWVARAYPSMMGLAAWYADLLLRIRVRPLSPGVPADPHPRGQQNMGYEGGVCPRQRPRGPYRPGLCQSRAGRARPAPHRHPGCRRLPHQGGDSNPRALSARAHGPCSTHEGSRLVNAPSGTPHVLEREAPLQTLLFPSLV